MSPAPGGIAEPLPPLAAIVTVEPAPPSDMVIPVPAVNTLSLVRVPFNVITTYSAFVGAPPPPPPPVKKPFPVPTHSHAC